MLTALQTVTRDSAFASTRWTIVREAADYWRPVYVFLRRQGIPQHVQTTGISNSHTFSDFNRNSYGDNFSHAESHSHSAALPDFG